VLYSFTGGSDGYNPLGELQWIGSTGVLNGTTAAGGTYGCGTVFALTPSGNSWTFATLYSFKGGSDGCNPETAVHTGPKTGTLFGATAYGGSDDVGTAFELAEKNGTWNETVLHTFSNGSDGGYPLATEVDTKGDIFGVAQDGGDYSRGTVYEIKKGYGKGAFSVLYDFPSAAKGALPQGTHLDLSTGNLYGTTEHGGSNRNEGTVFELVQSGNSWQETVLHSFRRPADGHFPAQRPIMDPKSGLLYGTTPYGGGHGGGTLYMVTP
jgi:hypothetical protein